MSADAGRDMLLQLEDSPGAGTYTTIAKVRAKSVSVNNEEIDISSGDSQWKERLSGGGLKELAVSVSGVADDGGQLADIAAAVEAGTLLSFRLISLIRTWTTPFHISSIEISGDYTDAQLFSATLVSSGQPTVS